MVVKRRWKKRKSCVYSFQYKSLKENWKVGKETRKVLVEIHYLKFNFLPLYFSFVQSSLLLLPIWDFAFKVAIESILDFTSFHKMEKKQTHKKVNRLSLLTKLCTYLFQNVLLMIRNSEKKSRGSLTLGRCEWTSKYSCLIKFYLKPNVTKALDVFLNMDGGFDSDHWPHRHAQATL